jgi:micrococcal nuclease
MTRLRFVLPVLASMLVGCGDAPAQDDSGRAPSDGSNPVGEAARIVRIFDGDSMEVEIAGSIVELRMIGINAPEGDECHGDAARDALRGLLAEGAVVLEEDTDDLDRYGRMLRYLRVDGIDVNQRMLELGHAVALSDGHTRRGPYRVAARDAMDRRIGMWQPEACGPASGAAVDIPIPEFDPPGRDEENPLLEYVDIRNAGDVALDMERWTLRDESTQHRYDFGPVVVPPGASVRVRSGCGEDRDLDLAWCAADPVWSNGGDTVILQDDHGNVVAWRVYEGRG